MPKGRKVIKTANSIKKVNVKRKLRIGTRKNGVGANTMSNERLREVLEDTNKTRYHGKARTVLNARGVKV